MADVILLDVRGMNVGREGTSYEIALLAKLGALPRVLAVGDHRTDWAHIEAVLREANGDPSMLKRCSVGRRKDCEIVLQSLIDIVEKSPNGPGHSFHPSHGGALAATVQG